MAKVYTGIDIGTYHVKVVIAAAAERPDIPMQILGTGMSSSRGIRHGYIIDGNEATRSIREALGRACNAAKITVKSARIAMGGVSLDEVHSTGESPLTQSGGIVTERDVEHAKAESVKRASSRLSNRTVLHVIPLQYRLDGAKIVGKPEGLQGTKLSVDTLLVTILTQHHDDLVNAVEKSGVEVEAVMASPLSASLVTLTRAQKTAGVALVNIGAETLSLIIFDNDTPVSTKVFPIGGSDITNSIALSFQIPLPEAESLKRGGVTGSEIPERKMQTIITAQLKDMFTIVNAHLKTINRARLLPAGIVITGGGSGIVNASEIARAILKLPSQIGAIGFVARTSSIDATWAVAYGLCRWGYAEDLADEGTSIIEVLKHAWKSVKDTLRALMP